jgi:hypothetical protein
MASYGTRRVKMLRMSAEEKMVASFVVLLVGKLTGWNMPTGGGGDPVYLTGEQTQALAAEGISLLTSFLPEEAAQRITSAIEQLPRAPHGNREERLLRTGSLGGTLVDNPDGPPGCCVGGPHGLVCVR